MELIIVVLRPGCFCFLFLVDWATSNLMKPSGPFGVKAARGGWVFNPGFALPFLF